MRTSPVFPRCRGSRSASPLLSSPRRTMRVSTSTSWSTSKRTRSRMPLPACVSCESSANGFVLKLRRSAHTQCRWMLVHQLRHPPKEPGQSMPCRLTPACILLRYVRQRCLSACRASVTAVLLSLLSLCDSGAPQLRAAPSQPSASPPLRHARLGTAAQPQGPPPARARG